MLSVSNVISIVSDKDSWINLYINELLNKLRRLNYKAEHVHSHDEISCNDVVLYLSYSCVVSNDFLSRNKHNLVVHESDLPDGKGWSPLTWQILEGRNFIPIVLFEANEKVDSGRIYLKDEMSFSGYELIDGLRSIQGEKTIKLILDFLLNYKQVINGAKDQVGEESFYPKRVKKDSELDINKSIKEQFNLLRVVDNDKYPAYFYIDGNRYTIGVRMDVNE